jgi:type II secretory pathway pseudopilin PulG
MMGSNLNCSMESRPESGYALVATLAFMSILMVTLTAAVPSIVQQSRRDIEEEAIYRGEQVAEALRQYVRANHGRLPTTLDQLKEGVSKGTRKVQILRASAARDPLTEKGEWKLVIMNDQVIPHFQKAVMLYNGGVLPPTSDPFLKQFQVRMQGLVDLKSDEAAPGGEDTSTSATGPSIGVVSKSRRQSVRTYYGIERHDRWVFTPLYR